MLIDSRLCSFRPNRFASEIIKFNFHKFMFNYKYIHSKLVNRFTKLDNSKTILSSNEILPVGKHSLKICFSVPFGFSFLLPDHCETWKLLCHPFLEGSKPVLFENLSLFIATCYLFSNIRWFGANARHSIRSVHRNYHVCIDHYFRM